MPDRPIRIKGGMGISINISGLIALLLTLSLGLPVEAKRGFFGYGNYCGKSNNGGPAINRLDQICKNHDRCLLRRGLPASPISLLKRSRRARKKSCHCDRIFHNEIDRYNESEGMLAWSASYIIWIYAKRRRRVSCGKNLKGKKARRSRKQNFSQL